MKAASIEGRIYDWFKQRHPAGPSWRSASFSCFQDAPIELRMILMMDKVEAEITNGGLAQLLWNVFFHWRSVLNDSEIGYEMIEATAQRDAIREFRKLLERYEPECRNRIDRCIEDQDSGHFNKWYEFGEAVMDSSSEELFYSESGVHELRLAWMGKNEKRLLQLMAT